MEILTNPYVIGGLAILGFIVGGAIALFKTQRKEDKKTMQVNSAVVAVLLAALAGVLFSMPVLSIDIESIFSYAFQIVEALMPLVALTAGLALGFNLVAKIGGMFRRAV